MKPELPNNSLTTDASSSSPNKSFPVSNTDALEYFAKPETTDLFLGIYEGRVACKRHTNLVRLFRANKEEFGPLGPISKYSNVDFLENDNQVDKEICSLLMPLFDQSCANPYEPDSSGGREMYTNRLSKFRSCYISHVWVPRGLISLLESRHGWTYEEAETFFLDVESRVSLESLVDLEAETALDQEREAKRKLREEEEELEARKDRKRRRRIEKPSLEPVLEDQSYDLPDIDLIEEVSSAGTEIPQESKNQLALRKRRMKVTLFFTLL